MYAKLCRRNKINVELIGTQNDNSELWVLLEKWTQKKNSECVSIDGWSYLNEQDSEKHIWVTTDIMDDDEPEGMQEKYIS